MEEEELNQTTETEENTFLKPDYDPSVLDAKLLNKTPKNNFRSPFNSGFGNSSVDLSLPENEKVMMDEYNEWFNLGRDRKWGILPYNRPEFQEERNELKDKWYQKYYGMNTEEFLEAKQANAKTIYGNSPDLKGTADQLNQNFQALMIPGLAYADFTNDALGTVVPGYGKLDDRWDEKTKLDNPVYQGVRRILSVVLPAIHTGGKINQTLSARGVNQYPWLAKNLTRLGAHGLADGTIAVLSDTSEDDNAAKVVADMLPGLFGPKGRVPFPDSWKTSESNSPAANRAIHFWENFGLAGFGTILGAFIDSKSAVKTPLDFFEPLDEVSAKYKQLELFKTADSEDLIRLQELNTLISSGKLNRQTENQIINEIIEINERLGTTTTLNDLLRRKELGLIDEADAAARRKLANVDEAKQLELELDPDISPGILDPASEARRSVPPANVARNMADTTAIKNGTSEGDPAPIITEAMREKGLMVGSRSRDAVMGVAEETRDVGRFNAVVDGIRYSTKQMNAAAWDIYTSIIAAENLDDVKALFYENRDVKNFLMGRFKVDVMNEEQARAAAFALRDLTDRFLGREVSEASARVMDTLGRESATLAESIQQGAGYVDESRVMDLIIDKMQFLLDEYALNKYLSGWSLRNKNWFDQVPPKELDTVIEQLTKEFTDAENAIHARNLRFTETLKETKKVKPHFLRPLVDAYAHTNGDVDTLAKLNKWAASQVSPMGMLKSPDPKEMNLFAKAAWSVVMNNVLSGLSAFRAGVGNTYALIMKPITGVLGHGIWGVTDEFEGLKRTVYAYGSIYETNRRALSDGFQMMKKAHKDPDMMIKAYRKDFTFQADKKWDIMDEMRGAWEVEGDYGKIIQHDAASLLKDLGRHPALRYGMTGLVFPDAYTSTMLAHYLSRVRAYDDVFSEFGFADWTKIHAAEAKHYKKFFDANGLIKDDVLRSVAGEIQLNLDDGLANWINKGTNAYPITKFLAMFPRTSSNYIKASASWTPLSLIPGFNKYSKTIYARTKDDIAKALAEHGIDMATTPNAQVIFENLRAEYTGRLAFSTLLVGTLWQYAMGGNIRGNGHYNASRRTKERDNFGYEPKTINIGGKWVSYKGIWGIEQMLSILGDMSYYAKDLNEPVLASWQSKLSWTLAASFLNETPLQGFEPLIAATNGDLSGWTRLIANTSRSFLPLSGGAGVLANAISSSQKDLEGEVREYIANRLPGFNHALPEQIDIWTGTPLNDIDNPFLRILNAMSPIKVSGTREPWRVWLQEIQYDGLSRLKKDSTGSYEYSAKEREVIYQYLGEMKLYKEIERIMKNPKYKEDIAALRVHRSTNADLLNDRLSLKKKQLPVYQEINFVLRRAQQEAENRLLMEHPEIADVIRAQQEINYNMKKGNVERAGEIQKRDLETQQLLQYGGNR
tara:strand:- start:1833 stop:6068 length:4236 start_codon:yes stop_codon:yes gene_type:complete